MHNTIATCCNAIDHHWLIAYTVNSGQPNVYKLTPPKNASGFPIKQWSQSSETPPGYIPGEFDPVESISAIRMSIRAVFTTPLYRPQTPYGLSRAKYMPAGSDFCCFACRTTGRLAGSPGLQATGVRPRLRRVSGMTQSGAATTALRWPVQDNALLTISTLRGCAGGGWWACNA